MIPYEPGFPGAGTGGAAVLYNLVSVLVSVEKRG